ncbi:uncharacterized protein Aud_009375 [Aspergillus udagawae]|uniref:Uncharacterized protein n=1 Tax=Aspergillus udagawae TaxID=91492 RepID=A0A8E0R0W5_9EURO|nr:uncharacterized protein Aud_009375 [Aspergillus udagawae]GIC92899.1 hypothetical protein Aud_009375 [Aspergillus udagawae]
MSDNNTSNKTCHPSPSAANESTLQPPGDVRPCQRCPNQTCHSTDRCPLRPLPTAVRNTTSVTTRPGLVGTTKPALVISVGVNHISHYSSPTGTVPTVVIETPTVAVQIRDKPKRRRRKRPNKAARRARLAAERINSQDATPAAMKPEDSDDKVAQ